MQDNETEVKPKRKITCPLRRYYISFMLCIGYIFSYSTRVNLSVAILYMTNPKNNGTNGNNTRTSKELNWDETLQGYALASFFYGYIVTQIPGGWLAGVIGGPYVLLIGIVGSGLLSFVAPVAAANSFVSLIFVRIGCGLLQGLIIPAANSIWANWSPPFERTILSGIAISGNFLSPLIVLPICGVIGDNWGWEWMFYFFGIISCFWGFIWFFTVKEAPWKDTCITEKELKYIEDSIGNKSHEKSIHPWGSIFRSPAVWSIIVAHTGHNWAFYTVIMYGPKFFNETEGHSVRNATIYTGSGYTICGILIQIFSQISDILRSKGVLTTKSVRKMFAGIGFYIQTSLMLCLSFCEIKLLTVALVILTIGLGGITWAGFYANSLDIATPHAAIIMGISNTFSTLSGIISPYIAAAVIPDEAPIKSDWLWVWLICAIFYFVAGTFFLIFAQGMNESELYVDTSRWARDLYRESRERQHFFSCSFCCKSWDRGNASALIAPVCFLFLAFLVYYYLVLPLNLQRDLCDVGFNYLTDGSYKTLRHKKRNKRDLVREVQRMRKIGELPPVYPNGWFVLLESSDVRRNEVKHVTALGENFAVFRNEHGEVHILDAYCPHLGANMAIGGRVEGNCLECPFHGWRFDGGSGECTSIPYSEGPIRGAVRVKKWPSREVNSLIFVWYHAEVEAPSWYPDGIDVIESGSWMFQGRSEFLVGCHIQEIPENGADVAHLNAIHQPSLFGGHDLRFYDRLALKFMRHVWTAEWKQSEEERHKGVLSLSFDTKILDKFSVAKMKVRAEQIGPGYVVLEMDTSWGPMLLLQTVTPVEAMLQRVVHRMYSPWQQTIFAKFTLYAELVMFGRDVMVWNHKKYLKKAHIVKEDKTITRHRRWYGQFYSEKSPKFIFRSDSLAW